MARLHDYWTRLTIGERLDRTVKTRGANDE